MYFPHVMGYFQSGRKEAQIISHDFYYRSIARNAKQNINKRRKSGVFLGMVPGNEITGKSFPSNGHPKFTHIIPYKQ